MPSLAKPDRTFCVYPLYEKLVSRLRSLHFLVKKDTRCPELKRAPSRRSTAPPPSRAVASVPCKVFFRTTRRADMTTICSWSTPLRPSVLTPNLLLRHRTSHNQIIPPLRSLFTTSDTVQSVLGSRSSRSTWVDQEKVPRVSEKLGSQLHTQIDTQFEKAVLQQLDALLPGVLESEIQASLHIARTGWIMSL